MLCICIAQRLFIDIITASLIAFKKENQTELTASRGIVEKKKNTALHNKSSSD